MVSLEVPSIGVEVVVCSLAKVLTTNNCILLSIRERMYISKIADEFSDIFPAVLH